MGWWSRCGNHHSQRLWSCFCVNSAINTEFTQNSAILRAHTGSIYTRIAFVWWIALLGNNALNHLSVRKCQTLVVFHISLHSNNNISAEAAIKFKSLVNRKSEHCFSKDNRVNIWCDFMFQRENKQATLQNPQTPKSKPKPKHSHFEDQMPLLSGHRFSQACGESQSFHVTPSN